MHQLTGRLSVLEMKYSSMKFEKKYKYKYICRKKKKKKYNISIKYLF